MLQKLGAANILRKENIPKLFLYPQSRGALHEILGGVESPQSVNHAPPFPALLFPWALSQVWLLIKKARE